MTNEGLLSPQANLSTTGVASQGSKGFCSAFTSWEFKGTHVFVGYIRFPDEKVPL